MIKRKNFLILILALSSMAFATKYEAEAATLSGGAKNVNASGVSGTGYADLQEGNISFNGVTAESAGKYQVTIHYKAGDFKANYLKVNGATAGTIDFNATTSWADVTTVATLKAGTNTISIEKYWGWISVDYIEVEPYQSSPFKISATPVTPNATESAVKLYSFLRENFGKKTISGMMTGDMSGYARRREIHLHAHRKVPGSCRFRFLVCKRPEGKRKLEQGIHGQSNFHCKRPLESGRHPGIHLALERSARQKRCLLYPKCSKRRRIHRFRFLYRFQARHH